MTLLCRIGHSFSCWFMKARHNHPLHTHWNCLLKCGILFSVLNVWVWGFEHKPELKAWVFNVSVLFCVIDFSCELSLIHYTSLWSCLLHLLVLYFKCFRQIMLTISLSPLWLLSAGRKNVRLHQRDKLSAQTCGPTALFHRPIDVRQSGRLIDDDTAIDWSNPLQSVYKPSHPWEL